MKTALFTGISLVVVAGVVVLVVFSGAPEDSQVSDQVVNNDPNYEPKAFSTYTKSTLEGTVGAEAEETSEEERSYTGTIVFRSDKIQEKRKQTCYEVLEEDFQLFPEPVSIVCANNEKEQLASIHLVGSINPRDKGVRYLVTARNATIFQEKASAFVIQVRKRILSEDETLTLKLEEATTTTTNSVVEEPGLEEEQSVESVSVEDVVTE